MQIDPCAEHHTCHRKLPPDGAPVYFGDNIATAGAWVPHGMGELYLDGDLQQQGYYVKGKLNGNGILVFKDGVKWEGGFLNGDLHGVGTFYYLDGTSKEALLSHNHIQCFKDGKFTFI